MFGNGITRYWISSIETIGIPIVSDPWNDVGHEVGVDPVDGAGVDISHLEQRWNLWVSCAAIDPDHVRHPPVFAVLNDHGHACTDVQKHRVCFGRWNGARMINRHTPLASTAVLVQEKG